MWIVAKMAIRAKFLGWNACISKEERLKGKGIQLQIHKKKITELIEESKWKENATINPKMNEMEGKDIVERNNIKLAFWEDE